MRIYRASAERVSISAVADLLWIASATTKLTKIRSLWCRQLEGETSEQLAILLFYTTTDNAANGTAVTPRPVSPSDSAFAGTVRSNITGASLSAETTFVEGHAMNVVGDGFEWQAVSADEELELAPVAGTNGRFVMKLDTAPAAALNFSYGAVLVEHG